MNKLHKKGQEEILGFVLIMIIVVIALVFFLLFSLKNDNSDLNNSYEVDSFIQSILQHTTSCEDTSGNMLDIQDVIFQCDTTKSCSDGKEACVALKEAMMEVTSSSWPIGESRPDKGYDLFIVSNDENILSIEEGTKTSNSKGFTQSFSRSSSDIEITFIVYS